MKEEGTILASYGSYGQYEGRPLKRGFHGAIIITKLKRMKSLESYGFKIFYDARMECKDEIFMK